MIDEIAVVRGFSRRYTGAIGVLQEGVYDTHYTLTEARVLYELGQTRAPQLPTEVLELRRTLDLDAGYLSRILARFEADRLLTRERSTVDARRQTVSLTDQGAAVSQELGERSNHQIRALLDGLSDEHRTCLVAAMRTIHEILDGTSPDVIIRQLRPGDYGWVVERNAYLYHQEYGWDFSYEALVARIVADYLDARDLKRENAWMAETRGARVGCVFCMREDEETARLRLLLVDPAARGLGLGSRLVDECVAFARRVGYKQLVLWTNDVLTSARHIYQRAGFELVESAPHHSFGHDLVGQTWRLPLR
jgi:DNA-binding MarR family transcriptional regulator/GNAT superfamily N-acetyltransferase